MVQECGFSSFPILYISQEHSPTVFTHVICYIICAFDSYILIYPINPGSLQSLSTVDSSIIDTELKLRW
jgi:hypothetical protein